MKQVKRLSAALSALILSLALAVPAFAAQPSYSITIRDGSPGHTYQAYQIFTGQVSDDSLQTGDQTGPVLSDIAWGSGVDGAGLLAALKQVDAGKYGPCTTAAQLAAALSGATAADTAAFAQAAAQCLVEPPTGESTGQVDGTYVIQGLPAGYYLVRQRDATGDDSAYIVQVLGNVTMQPKGSGAPTLEKKVWEESLRDTATPYGYGFHDVADYHIGDLVQFKLIGSLPDLNGYDHYTYRFHDTLSTGLTLDASSFALYAVYEKDDNPADPGWVQLDPSLYEIQTDQTQDGGGSFTVTLKDLKQMEQTLDAKHRYFVLSYYTTLNENAQVGLEGNPNQAYLEFSDQPGGIGTGVTATDRVVVFTYAMQGTKVDAKDSSVLLEGAQFVLFNGGYTRVARFDSQGRMVGWAELPQGYTHQNCDDIPYEAWLALDGQGSVILTSSQTGSFGLTGLDEGTYYLREIQAPGGYNLLEEDVKVTLAASTGNVQDWSGAQAGEILTQLSVSLDDCPPQSGDPASGVVCLTVVNRSGATLPETGGTGTTLFYLFGTMLVLGAGAALSIRLRAGSGRQEE